MDGPPHATTNRDPDGHGPCIREKQTHKLKTSIQPSRERSPRAPLRHSQTVGGSESVIRISEMVMYPKSHPRSVPITQPCITVMVHLLQLSTIQLPAVLCHIIPEKQSLFLQTRRSHRQVQDHVQSQPHVDRHTISHTQKHQHTISISHTQMEHL